MRRLFSRLALVLALASPATVAPVVVVPVALVAVAPQAEAAASATYIGTTADTSDATTYTFTNHAIGTASSDRCVVVGIRTSRGVGTAHTISSATIGGNAASIIADRNWVEVGNSGTVGFISLLVTSGTTATIAVTMSTAMVRMVIAVWAVTGTADCTTLADTDTSTANDPSVALDVPANGTALGGCGATANAGNSTTWTGLTERSDAQYETTALITFGSLDFAAQQTGLTITCDFTATTNLEHGAFISFGPASAATTPARVIGGGVF